MTQTTHRSPSTIDEETFSVRRSVVISAPAEKVWSAVTEPAQISRWFGAVALDGRGAGAVGTISWPDRAGIPLRVESVDPLRSVAYRWNNDDASGVVPAALDESRSTVFTFTLEPVEGGTLLTVVESGFEATSDAAANLESHRSGWNIELDKLIAGLEGAGL